MRIRLALLSAQGYYVFALPEAAPASKKKSE